MSAVAVHIPYYATALRHDKLADALADLTPELLRLGALEVRVFRAQDDAYKFRQVLLLADKADWTRIWNSEAFITFRTVTMAWYQKPLAYEMFETISQGTGAGVVDVFADDPFATPAPVDATPVAAS
ncbi:MAG: hypothetical protein M0P31_18535 [Solirubrobacteraceae bacterium]|nr:hypothetical protein [Solirubrobacteraceae bacterium]